MSQEQPRRPLQADQQPDQPIKYGDVFPVSGELASTPVAPQDAAMMQTAENVVLGKTQKGGPAAVMQSAATHNEQAGLVGHTDVSDVAGEQGVTVTEIDVPGRRIITEQVAGQVVGHYNQPAPVTTTDPPSALDLASPAAITIGEALEGAAISGREKIVDQCDAAAIQAAEIRATGSNVIQPGGIAAAAQSAATTNARTLNVLDQTTLGDVLTNATVKLPADKVVTAEDAQGVVGAELRNSPTMATYPGGVAESVAAAAGVNQTTH